MGFQTTTGAFMSIGPAPATLDAAGFGAVAVDKIGGVTDMGAMGKVFNTATLTPMDTKAVIEKKTSYVRQSPDVALAIDDADTGQIAAAAALETYDSYTIKVTRQNGDAIYFTAQVASFTYTQATDAFENGSIKLLPQSDLVKVAAI
jgi:hypothetical protein